MPRRCRRLSASNAAGLSFVAAIALLWPAAGRAQTANALNAPNTQTAAANPDADLFLPSLQGSPNNPSRFVLRPNAAAANQAPPPGAFTGSAVPPLPRRRRSMAARPALAPAIPDSTRPMRGAGKGRACRTAARRSCRRRRRRPSIRCPRRRPKCRRGPPTPAPPLPPEVYPSRAASRPGATLPPPQTDLPISNVPAEVHPLTAAVRPGAALPLPPPPLDISSPASAPPPGTPVPGTLPLGAVPRPTLPFIGGDPYEPLGLRAGSFIILPAVELSPGYDNNPQHTPGGPGSSTFFVAPELHVRSDWPVNSFTADIVGSYYWYGNDGAMSPPLNRPYLNSKLDGRIDVTRNTQILLENRYIVSTDNPGSPNIQAGLAKLPINPTVGGTLGVERAIRPLRRDAQGHDRPHRLCELALHRRRDREQRRPRLRSICRHFPPGLLDRSRPQAVRRSQQ